MKTLKTLLTISLLAFVGDSLHAAPTVSFVKSCGNESISTIANNVRMWSNISNSLLWDYPDYLGGAQYLRRRTQFTTNYPQCQGVGETWYNWLGDDRVTVSEESTAVVGVRDLSSIQRQGLVDEGWYDLGDALTIQTTADPAGDLYHLFSQEIPAGLVDVTTDAFSRSRATVFMFQSRELVPDGLPSETLLHDGSVWNYLDNGSNQSTAWQDPLFDDSQWASGPAQLGYGDDDEETVVNCGPSATACNSNNQATTYFRTSFEVETTAQIDSLAFLLTRDDAAAVYLNGTEVFRDTNLPSNAGFNTYATDTGAENGVIGFSADAMLLNIGTNVLAVEVHQVSPNSSDISFDLSLTAKLNPVPEPTSLILTLLGIVGMAAGYRRRAA